MHHHPQLPLRLSVALALALALAVATSGRAGAQTISAELPAPRPPAQPDPWRHRSPIIAAAPSGERLIVYHTATPLPTNAGSIASAVRVDAAGNVLDPIALEVGPSAVSYNTPNDPGPTWATRMQAAWTGSGYLVVWLAGGQVQGRVIPASGPAAPMFTISTTPVGARWPSVACSPTECLVAWWTFENGVGHRVWLARVAGGAVIQTAFPVTTAASDQHEPAVAFDGTDYLVVWRDIRRPDGGDIYATRVTTSGTLRDPTGFAVSAASGAESEVALTRAGSDILAAWLDTRSGTGSNELWSTRIGPGASVAAPGGVRLATSVGADGPSLSWNGTDYLAAWRAPGGVHTIRVSAAGVPDPAGSSVLIPTGTSRPDLASVPGAHLLVWVDSARMPTETTLERRLPATGAAGPDLVVGGVASAESEPSLASDGTRYLLTWTDTRHGWKTIYGTRLDEAGTALDGTGRLLSPETRDADRYGATVSWGNGMYLCVWQRRPLMGAMTIEATRLGADGTVLDPTPMQLSPGVFFADRPRPSIAWNGSSWLVVWTGFDGIEGARVSPQGQVLDTTPLAISRSTSNITRDPVVAWTGTVHLVVWTDGKMGFNRTFGARLGPTGAHLDAADLSIGSGNFMGDLDPALASDGQNLLLVYILPGSSPDAGRMYARRLDQNAMPRDAAHIDITGLFSEVLRPSVVWDGDNWFMTWMARDAGALRALRLTPAGAPIYPIAMLQAAPGFGRPVLASRGGGHTAAFWQRQVSFHFQNQRAREDHVYGAIAACGTGQCIGPPPPDGGLEVDAALPGPDAGTRPPSGGGGGCDTSAAARRGGALAGPLLLLAVLALVAWAGAKRFS